MPGADSVARSMISGRAEALEIVGLARPAGRGDDLPALAGEQRDRGRSDAARGAGHQYRARGGRQAVPLERQHAQHRRVAGGADRHRLGAAQARRQFDQPVALDPRLLGVAAEMRLAEAVAVDDHLVARREAGMARRLDHAGQIDAEHHRKAADHRRLAREREAVLVVDRGMADADGDVAVHQLRLLHRDEADLLSGVGLVGSHGFERHGIRLSLGDLGDDRDRQPSASGSRSTGRAVASAAP